jgi:hypothetical protein
MIRLEFQNLFSPENHGIFRICNIAPVVTKSSNQPIVHGNMELGWQHENMGCGRNTDLQTIAKRRLALISGKHKQAAA